MNFCFLIGKVKDLFIQSEEKLVYEPNSNIFSYILGTKAMIK